MPYVAYIEEAGDEGIQQGSRWFVVGAVVVEKSEDLAVSRCIDTIKQRLRIPPTVPLHWRKIKHPSMRRLIIEELKAHDFRLAYVLCDTSHPTIVTSTLRGKGRLYFYTVRYLIERLSWFGREHSQSMELVFANRSHVRYADLREYLERIQEDQECQIAKGIIDVNQLRVEQVAYSKLLQASDVCNGACFNAFQRDHYGYYEERYMVSLAQKLYCRKGNLFSYGMKFLPSDLHLDAGIRADYPWLSSITKMQTPSSRNPHVWACCGLLTHLELVSRMSATLFYVNPSAQVNRHHFP